MAGAELLAAVARMGEGFATHSAPFLDAIAFELWLRHLQRRENDGAVRRFSALAESAVM
jgi:hypothetical protein